MRAFLKALIFTGSISMIFGSCSQEFTNYKDEQPNLFRGSFETVFESTGEKYIADEKLAVVYKQDLITSFSIGTKMYSYNLDPTKYKTITLAVGDYKGPGTYLVDINTSGTAYTDYYENIPTLFETKMNDERAFITIESDGDLKRFKGTFTIVVRPNGSTDPKEEIVLGQGKFDVEI